MIYDEARNILYTDVSEAVTAARRGIGASHCSDEEAPMYAKEALPQSYKKEDFTELCHNFKASCFNFCIKGKVLFAKSGEITVAFAITTKKEKDRREAKEQYRGEAYMLGAMYVKEMCPETESLTIKTIYYALDTKEELLAEETASSDKLIAFFNKCVSVLPLSARAEIDRVTVRIPSMKSVKFPYVTPREGQDEFIRTAYRTMARGGTLYATAPTGTGKTVSALFPAIRALGNGKCSKVFYLTPKTTTAAAAKECIERLCVAGAKIKAALIIAKDRVCTNGSVCKNAKRLCPTFKENRISEAAMALFDADVKVAMPSDFRDLGKKFNVCPYELSLTYAELCDVIICDFNYLFDPQVYIRRFFSSAANYAFLIDEAHNLGERAREMYSAEITLSELACAEILGELSLLRREAEHACKVFSGTIEALIRDEVRKDKDGVNHGAYHSRDIPYELYDVFEKLTAAAEDELYAAFSAKDDERDERISFIRDYLFRIRKFNASLLRFDDSFEFFAFIDGDELRAKVFCLDTGPIIREKLELGRSAVIFSGTLSPIDYYRSVLGGERTSSVLTLDSPFDGENLSVSVMNKITTRYSEREDSLFAVCRVIAATLSAKRGNYMIFSPSFAYAEALCDAFRKKYPKIRVILQKSNMTQREKQDFLSEFSKADGTYLAAFCVLGGIYSEGIDLVGDKLIGAVIVGIGMPALSFEREAIAAYYEEKLEEGVRYAYLYPGINRVLQAAGRVIRTETDRGVIVLIDDRFDDPIYKKTAPKIWSGMQFLDTPKELRERLDKFWAESESHSR